MRTSNAKPVVTWVAALLVALSADAAGQSAVDQNAALRYWTAFAQMQNQPAGELAEELGEVEAGRVPFDEARHGPVLDANAAALATLLRASRLPSCDWGVETELGPAAPIAYIARARALARLNTIEGIRRARRGEVDAAVDRWMAGVRFSRHIAAGGSLLAQLSGWNALRSAFGAIEGAHTRGMLSEAHRRLLFDAIEAIPETGFAWDAAWRLERRALDVWVSRLAQEQDFRPAYARATGAAPPAGLTLPGTADAAAFSRYMGRVADALALPPEAAQEAVIEAQRIGLPVHDFYEGLLPDPFLVNKTRADVGTARGRILDILSRNFSWRRSPPF